MKTSNGSKSARVLLTCLYVLFLIEAMAALAKEQVSLFAIVGLLAATMFVLVPGFRWVVYSNLMSISSLYSMGADALGCKREFELPDGRTMTGTVVRCSPAWSWFIVEAGGTNYFIELKYDHPIGWCRYIALEEVVLPANS